MLKQHFTLSSNCTVSLSQSSETQGRDSFSWRSQEVKMKLILVIMLPPVLSRHLMLLDNPPDSTARATQLSRVKL